MSCKSHRSDSKGDDSFDEGTMVMNKAEQMK